MNGLTTAEPAGNSTAGNPYFVFEDYTQRTIIVVILCFVFIAGVTGNTLVIAAVVLSRKLRSVTNFFVVNLACADLLLCLSLPFNMVAMLSRNGWPLPGWVCAVTSAISLVCLGASIDTLALIAYNRWYLLTQPRVNFQRLYKRRNILLMVFCAWLYPLMLVLIPHFAGLGRLGYSAKYKTCTQDTSLPYSDYYSLLAGAGTIIPVFISIAVMYAKIYRFVSEQNKKLTAISQSEMPRSVNNKNDGVTIEMSSSSLTGQNTDSTALDDEPGAVLDPGNNPTDVLKASSDRDNEVALESLEVSVPPVSIAVAKRATSDDNDTLQIKAKLEDTTQQNEPGHSSLSAKNVALDQRKSPKKSAPSQLNRHHVTVTKKLAIVVLAFLICLLPFGISVAVPPSDPGIPWTGLMVTFNSCINPIIYARTMPVFREVMGCIIRCRFRSIPDPTDCIRRRY